MGIFIDTNALSRGHHPLTVTYMALKRVAEHKGLAVLLSDLVIEESTAGRVREAAAALGAVSTALNKASKSIDLDSIYLPNPDELGRRWREELLQSFEVIPIDADDAREALTREAERRKPAKGSGVGARDCAIWLTVKRQHEQTGGPTYFVSDNIEDFADKQKRQLHPDLVAEIERNPDSLIYVRSVGDLLGLLADKTDLTIELHAFSEVLEPLAEELAFLYSDTSDVLTPDVFLNDGPTIERSTVLAAYRIDEIAVALVDLGVRARLASAVDMDETTQIHEARFLVRAWLEVVLPDARPRAVSLESASFIEGIVREEDRPSPAKEA